MIKTFIQKKQLAKIAEIHNEFDTAEDRLLKQAQEIIENSKGDENIERLAERLQNIGFKNTPIVKQAEKVKEDKKQVVKTKEQADLIQYYKFTYPFLKFLTEEELDRICEKYNLIHAPVGNYIENVPVKNLREIEISQELKECDNPENKTICEIVKLDSIKNKYKNIPNTIELTNDEINSFDNVSISFHSFLIESFIRDRFNINDVFILKSANLTTVPKNGLFIAAPSSHFNLEGLDKKSKHGFFKVFKTEIKDPIVFRYCRGGIQVLSKWGLEANDPSLIVDTLN